MYNDDYNLLFTNFDVQSLVDETSPETFLALVFLRSCIKSMSFDDFDTWINSEDGRFWLGIFKTKELNCPNYWTSLYRRCHNVKGDLIND